MNDYLNVENELLKVNRATFQRIAFRIVNGEYDNPLNIVHLGQAEGVDETKTGVPDIYFQLPNGNYVYVEVTAQKVGVNKKILEDLESCQKTAQDSGNTIEKVIYACLKKPADKQLASYLALCKSFCVGDNPFELWGLDKITTFLTMNYQYIARDELHIKFTHGSFRTLAEYLTSDKYDISQVHEFLHRDQELVKIKASLLSRKVILLHGKSGCGKTRLAIEVAKDLLNQNGFSKVYVVKGALEQTMSDVQLVNDGKPMVFILDDANRNLYLKDFIAYTQNYQNVYVIATVRDYAVNDITTKLDAQGLLNFVDFMQINLLTKEQQEEVVKKVLPNITHDGLKTILNISAGNLRFAIMCAEVVKKTNAVPKSIKDLMDEYFNRINDDLKNLGKEINNIEIERETKISLLVTALLHRFVDAEDKFGRKNPIEILTSFGIERSQFINAMLYWEHKEAVDISFNCRVFEISDQILANYLFYKLVFEEKIVTLQQVFEATFPAQRSRIIDMMQSIVPVRGYNGTVIETAFLKLWNDKYKKEPDSNETVQFVEAFNALLPEESLAYIQNQVKAGKSKQYINLLCRFVPPDYCEVATDIIINILQEFEDDDRGRIVDDLAEAFSVTHNTYIFDLVAPICFVKKLIANFSKGNIYKDIFIKLADRLLKFSFNSTEANGNRGIVMHTAQAVPCESIFEVRKLSWQGMVELYNLNYAKSEIFKVLNSNSHNPSITDKQLAQIVEKDKEVIIELMSEFTPKNFADRVFYKRIMECVCSENEDALKKRIAELEKEDLGFSIYSRVHAKTKRFEHDFIAKQYKKIFPEFKDCAEFFCYLRNLVDFNGDDAWGVSSAIDCFFLHIDETEPARFFEILKQFFSEFPAITCHPAYILRLALKHIQAAKLFDLINKSRLQHKENWLMVLFESVKKEDINDDLYNSCIKLIKDNCINAKGNFCGGMLTHLLQFEEYKKGFVIEVFEELIKVLSKKKEEGFDYFWTEAFDSATGGKRVKKAKSKKNEKDVNYDFFEHLYYKDYAWNHYELTAEKIEAYFGDKVESLYYEGFYQLLRFDRMSDCSFATYLGRKDIQYVYRYYDIIFDKSSYDNKYDVLKEFPNIAENLIEIMERTKHRGRFSLENILQANLDDDEFKKFINLYVEKHKNDADTLLHIASIACNLKNEWQFSFAEKLIEVKVDIDLFEKMSILGHPNHWSGGDVAVTEATIKRMDEFLKRVDITADTLQYIAIIKNHMVKMSERLESVKLQALADDWLND